MAGSRTIVGWCAMALGCVLAIPACAQTSFEGQTIRLVISSTASGPTDTIGRQFAPFIARHLPGKPSIVPENRPGGVGVIAANYMFGVAKPDGLTIGLIMGMVTQGLMGSDVIRYDPAKFQLLGSISQTQVLLARKDLELKSPRDLLKPAKPLVFASLGSGSTTDTANRLFLDMIGAKYQYVVGYPGQAEAILAVARGEANIANAGDTTYLSRRESIRAEGIYDAIVQRGELTAAGTFRRNHQLADLPTQVETINELNPKALDGGDFATFRSIVGALAVHFAFVAPPATPAPVVEALRKAVAGGIEDPEARKVVGGMLKTDYVFVSGSDSQRMVERLRTDYTADPRIGQRLREMMTSK